ncbi:MAG: M20/M25/M40 family metallo-hydrolase [Clostridia bacterium]|nr:M20/M25/M40 family metallo-hydrolase [Clostridia bacterium]
MKYIDKLDEKVLNYLDNSYDEMRKLLKELAVIPAPSGQEDLRVDYVKNWFENVGAKQIIVDEAKNVIVPIDCDNKDEIVVFMAHTDLVFPDLSPLPYSEDGEYIYCPGIGDDTSCLAVLMMVAKYVIQNNLKSKYGILFVANSCEEGLGDLKGSRQIVKDYGDKISAFYTFDGCYNEIINQCVGSHRYEISFATEGGHSFLGFGRRNAIVAMADLINQLYKCEIPKKEGTKTTYNVGIVEGGTSVNTIAQNAKMLYEYRSDDKECLAIMKKFFEEQIEKAKQSGKAEIEVKLVGDRPCMGDMNEEALEKITAHAIAVCEKYSGVTCHRDSGSTDANIPMSLGIPAVCVGNHISSGAHTRSEKLLISSLEPGMKITAELVLSYFD